MPLDRLRFRKLTKKPKRLISTKAFNCVCGKRILAGANDTNQPCKCGKIWKIRKHFAFTRGNWEDKEIRYYG